MSIQMDMGMLEDSLEKLRTLDIIIPYYLDNKSSMELLDKKLKQFNKLVDELPDWYDGTWSGEWHHKNRIYQQRFEDICRPTDTFGAEAAARIQNLALFEDPFKYGYGSFDYNRKYPIPAQIYNANKNSSFSYRKAYSRSTTLFASVKPKMDDLEPKLYNLYSQLRKIDSSADVNGLKQLLILMESSQKVIRENNLQNYHSLSNDSDHNCEAKLFHCALQKLPKNLQSQFVAQQPSVNSSSKDENDHSFQQLIDWLNRLLSDPNKRKHSAE